MTDCKKYIKTNVSPDTNAVLKILAAEKRKYIYEIIDDLVKEQYADYFRKIGC